MNIDQTLTLFASYTKKTLDMRGSKIINVCILMQDIKCTMLVVTLCTDGTKLLLMFIFKGAWNGKIIAKEVTNFPTDCEYYLWWEWNDQLGWKNSQTVYCNGNRKYYSLACVGFLLMQLDGIGGRSYQTAQCRSGAHPWWVYFTLPAYWWWNQKVIEDTYLQKLGGFDVGFGC